MLFDRLGDVFIVVGAVDFNQDPSGGDDSFRFIGHSDIGNDYARAEDRCTFDLLE